MPRHPSWRGAPLECNHTSQHIVWLCVIIVGGGVDALSEQAGLRCAGCCKPSSVGKRLLWTISQRFSHSAASSLRAR